MEVKGKRLGFAEGGSSPFHPRGEASNECLEAGNEPVVTVKTEFPII